MLSAGPVPMSPDVFLSATTFALAGSFTPGPNNTMLLASGVNYGFRRTLPHIAGITIGYAVMFAAVALGLGSLFTMQPLLYTALKIASSIYLLWLAWCIATATEPGEGAVERPPLTFLQAALFQWVNPKGVLLGIAASANFLDPKNLSVDLPIILALIIVMSLASASTWALFGQGLRGFLAPPGRLKIFNRVMGLALVASLWPLLGAHAL
ncbi:MAG: LysE family translocator [Hyphomicrobium sp.]